MSNELFKYIDQGAARTVYSINDNLVLKLAKNANDERSWGREQCITEIEMYLKYGNKIPLCKIFVDMSNETRILMEHVNPYNLMEDVSEEYEQQLDLLINTLEHYPNNVDDFLITYPNVKFFNFVKKFKESGLTQEEIRDILYDVGFENLGENAEGEIVILDYGMVYGS